MAFVPKLDWVNDPEAPATKPGMTPVKAEELIRIEQGIKAAHDAVAALPAPLVLGTTASTAAAGNHTHPAPTVATVTGLQAALDAKGTSNLALGTTSTTALAGNTPLLKVGTTATDAKAGDYQPTYASLPDKPTIPAAPAAGTAAQLSAGTDTTVRTWAAKVLADEIDARVAAAIAAIPPAE